jgi:hypothetical protein
MFTALLYPFITSATLHACELGSVVNTSICNRVTISKDEFRYIRLFQINVHDFVRGAPKQKLNLHKTATIGTCFYLIFGLICCNLLWLHRSLYFIEFSCTYVNLQER